jgi:hypothetical protein
MTDLVTAIEIPDFVTIAPAEPTMAALAGILADLLTGNGDLPHPRCVSLSRAGSEIDMQFPGTFAVMARWADRFGGTVTGEPRSDEDGPYVRCEVRFAHLGVQVKAYAYIKADKAT